MTYHDTPNQPLPAMRYLDTPASAGEKEAYTVLDWRSSDRAAHGRNGKGVVQLRRKFKAMVPALPGAFRI